MRHKIKRILALALAVCMMLATAACGNAADERIPAKEWVYMPEFITLEDEDVSYYNMQYEGGKLRWSSNSWNAETQSSVQWMCSYSPEDQTTSKISLDWGDMVKEDEDGYRRTPNVDSVAYGEDGSIYAVVRNYIQNPETGYFQSESGIAKFDAAGKLAFYRDLKECAKDIQGDVWLQSIALDAQGRLYASGDSGIFLFDAEGSYKGTVSIGSAGNSYIRAMGCGSDGKIYVSVYNYDESGSSTNLSEVDFDGKKLGASYADFPGGNSETLTAGENDSFIVTDDRTVYEYSLSTQTRTALFDWLDSDINGNNVRGIGVMKDGRILAVINDWESNDNCIALLTKKPGSEVAQKETILVATLSGAWNLQASAVKFNRSNDKYHVTIKQYMDYNNYSESSYEDAIKNLNNDLISKKNCPDIIDLSGLNPERLVAKRLLEDLSGYLDKDEELKREDFLESVLEACTYDGVLVNIPKEFTVTTLVGRPSDVGEEMGWTIEELMEFAQAHPGAQLLDNVSKSYIMRILLTYNADNFVDWSKGKCSFNSEEFIKLLTFVNSFPDEIDRDSEQDATEIRIQNGEVLLNRVNLYNFDEIQVQYEIFGGDITCIGYPTVDGSVGAMMQMQDRYAICTKARQKDGAWKFLSSILTEEENSNRSWGFPTRKAALDEMARKTVEVQYYTDSDGNLILDENGDPIEIGVGYGVGHGNWFYEYRRTTQEEVDQMLEVIGLAGAGSSMDSEILTIIDEEAEAFYKGQKTAEEVAKVIQSRASVYVSENS